MATTWGLDSSVLVELAGLDRLQLLETLPGPRLVPDIVDGELAAGKAKHPEQHARYARAVSDGLVQVVRILPGEQAYAEYLRIRSTRSSPMRNRGEDACVALALTLPGSIVLVNDHRGAAKARTELGDATRVLSFPWPDG